MRYYIDTEFHEDGRIIDLISIGIYSEDNRSFYAVSSNFNPDICDDFVKENVLPFIGESSYAEIGGRGNSRIAGQNKKQ